MGVIEIHGLEEHEPGDDGHLGGNHHGRQEEQENNVLSPEVYLGEGVGRHGGDDDLSEGGDDDDFEGVEVGLDHAYGVVGPHCEIIAPLNRFGD